MMEQQTYSYGGAADMQLWWRRRHAAMVEQQACSYEGTADMQLWWNIRHAAMREQQTCLPRAISTGR